MAGSHAEMPRGGAVGNDTSEEQYIQRATAAVKNAVAETYDNGSKVRGTASREEATRTLRTGQMTSRFSMMIQVAVTLAVGVLVVGQIFDALPNSTGPLANASDQVESLTATAFELAPIVLIVVVAALVLNVIRGI
ncbi:hypothetical protein [Halomarina rubra]|uniref:Uncharacterized protein n=1 Tax=Halomarina rubra TaxID=2071873 RepID=A0ABD6B1Q5_9EURY|nr:hypothetical protein [Halomarina rubra]